MFQPLGSPRTNPRQIDTDARLVGVFLSNALIGLTDGFLCRRFILIGDSGEKDPEVYGDIARAFPRQIDRILIRRAPGDRLGEARFAEAFAGLPANRWHVFDDPATVV